MLEVLAIQPWQRFQAAEAISDAREEALPPIRLVPGLNILD